MRVCNLGCLAHLPSCCGDQRWHGPMWQAHAQIQPEHASRRNNCWCSRRSPKSAPPKVSWGHRSLLLRWHRHASRCQTCQGCSVMLHRPCTAPKGRPKQTMSDRAGLPVVQGEQHDASCRTPDATAWLQTGCQPPRTSMPTSALQVLAVQRLPLRSARVRAVTIWLNWAPMQLPHAPRGSHWWATTAAAGVSAFIFAVVLSKATVNRGFAQ